MLKAPNHDYVAARGPLHVVDVKGLDSTLLAPLAARLRQGVLVHDHYMLKAPNHDFVAARGLQHVVDVKGLEPLAFRV